MDKASRESGSRRGQVPEVAPAATIRAVDGRRRTDGNGGGYYRIVLGGAHKPMDVPARESESRRRQVRCYGRGDDPGGGYAAEGGPARIR